MDLGNVKIPTPNGVIEKPIMKIFEFNGRTYVLNESAILDEKYAVTDYATGYAVKFGKNIRKVINEAKERLNTPAAKKFDYSTYEVLNP